VKIVAHDDVLGRMNSRPTTAWPTETFVGREKEIHFNGEPMLMYHVPSAHTDGDRHRLLPTLGRHRHGRYFPDR
jgi:hypothetical protein